MRLQSLGMLFIFTGIILAIIAVLLPVVFVAMNSGAVITGKDIKISAGGCVLIFFVPICFGIGEYSVFLMIIAIALALIVVLISYVLYRSFRR